MKNLFLLIIFLGLLSCNNSQDNGSNYLEDKSIKTIKLENTSEIKRISDLISTKFKPVYKSISNISKIELVLNQEKLKNHLFCTFDTDNSKGTTLAIPLKENITEFKDINLNSL